MIYEIPIDKKPISLNSWYSSNHWTKRQKQKKEWSLIFFVAIQNAKIKPIDKYKIRLIYNSRHDPSNTITMIKIFEDELKKQGLIIDDSKKYCRGVHLIPDESLKKDSFKIIIKTI